MAQTALVTGANRGLGFETCRQLGKQGFKVLLPARNRDAGTQTADLLTNEGLDVSFLHLDVASDESIESAASTLETQGVKLDVLINNAGVLLDPHTGWGDAEASILNAERETLRATMSMAPFGWSRPCCH